MGGRKTAARGELFSLHEIYKITKGETMSRAEKKLVELKAKEELKRLEAEKREQQQHDWEKSKQQWNAMPKGVKTTLKALGVIIVLFILIGIFTPSDSKNSPNNSQSNENTQTAQEPKDEKVLANKVQNALDKLGDDMKKTLASTSPDGYQGDIVSVEPAIGDDTVKVNVSTYFKDSGDGADGGQGIARRIFSNICFDVPELDSLYVVSSSGLESKSIYRSDIPGCKQ